ncbi:ABC transporter substrate-binding protein [Crocosphaera sp. Alani8]|uniref:ABC transporter substrate-binding protein n=1 Tax=Crocosphaera sp. Alani8 TaxID=3038952 RepID=UPI00313C7245
MAGAVYGLQNQANNSNPEDTPSPTESACIVDEVNLEEKRFSSGERELFSENNTNRDLNWGINEFKSGKYRDAKEFFGKARDADRVDPEAKIYYNNALARENANPFKIAAVVPIDSRGTSAKEILRGIADAQDAFNKAQGIGNSLLEVVIINDGNDPTIAARVAQYINEDGEFLGVIGHNSSEASKAALPCYQENSIAMISPTATSTSLQGGNFFRTVANNKEMAKVMGKYVKNDLKSDNVVIFYDDKSNYSKSFLEELEKDLDSAVIKNKININPPDFDVEDNVERNIPQTEEEKKKSVAILLPSTETTSVAIRIAKKIDKQIDVLGSDTLYLPDTLIQGGNSIEDMVVVTPITIAEDYQQSAATSWGGYINWRTVSAFDATQALIEAINNAADDYNNPTQKDILNQLPLINNNGVKSEASNKLLTFKDGERVSEPVLVRASSNAPATPQGSEFGFTELSP